MSRFQKPKEKANNNTKINNEILSVLENNYDGNMLYYNQAKEDVLLKHNMLTKLHNISNTFKPIPLIADKNDYITYIDFKNDEIGYINQSESLLAYSLDFFNYRRILPFSLTTFLNKQKSKDLSNTSNLDSYNSKAKIINWVENNFFKTNFSVLNVSLDRNNGMFKMNSCIKESSPCYQYVTCKIDLNKVDTISNMKRKEKDWIKNYNSLFAYFMLFSSEMYCRCNCTDYQTKYSKREGMANYMCHHLMWSLTMLPNYLFVVL